MVWNLLLPAGSEGPTLIDQTVTHIGPLLGPLRSWRTVASVAGFDAGQIITIDTGANLETAVIAMVGTAGATTAGAAIDVGATVIAVSNTTGFSAGQTITVDSGASQETAVVVSASGGRGGARITLAAPLTRAHAAGSQISGTGVTLTSALSRAHAGGTPVASSVPTPGSANKYYPRR